MSHVNQGAWAEFAVGQFKPFQGIGIFWLTGQHLVVEGFGDVVATTPALYVGQADAGRVGKFTRGQRLVGWNGRSQAPSPGQTVGNDQLQFRIRFFFGQQLQTGCAGILIVTR